MTSIPLFLASKVLKLIIYIHICAFADPAAKVLEAQKLSIEIIAVKEQLNLFKYFFNRLIFNAKDDNLLPHKMAAKPKSFK